MRSRALPVRLVFALVLLGETSRCLVFTARIESAGALTNKRETGIAAEDETYLAQGFYDRYDNVEILNVTNFQSTVYGSERAWLVEFYNSWCGYCRRFAPMWKSLAHDVRGWRDTVVIAALDCADQENNPLCRTYEIMRYPELRYFGPGERTSALGTVVEKGKDAEELRANVAKHLRKEQQEGRGDKWPNLTPFRSSEVKNIWDGVPDAVRYFFFLFEEVDSYLGVEIILDLRNVTSLMLRSVNSDNSLLCLMHEITRFPSLVVYSRDGTQKRLPALRVPTRAATRNAIAEFMRLRGIDISGVEKWIEAATPSRPVATSEANRPVLGKGDDALYRADLETTLRFSLGHEIPMMKLISGQRMSALKNFTSVLASYYPTRLDGGSGDSMFLDTIALVVGSKNAMSGEDFATLISSTEQEMSPVYLEPNEWKACKPSKKGLRGYPCGLWSLFHALTVNFAAKWTDGTSENPSEDPGHVLKAVRAYVKHFFGCADCALHFIEMSEKNGMNEVKSADEAILWLWRAHNEVNERLAGDETEDPMYPKIVYPSPRHCPACRNSDSRWNTSEVLAHLKRKYLRSGVKSGVFGFNSTIRSSSAPSPTTKVRDERLAYYEQRVNGKKFGWDFTIFDMSICVVLYVASAAILVLVCIKFAVKRSSHKKRIYVHSILGKV